MIKELVIISPTYNESKILEEFTTDWITKIRELNISFEFRIYDDGSTDATKKVLSDLQKNIRNCKCIQNRIQGMGQQLQKLISNRLNLIGFSN